MNGHDDMVLKDEKDWCSKQCYQATQTKKNLLLEPFLKEEKLI